jgi:hypothetical protein
MSSKSVCQVAHSWLDVGRFYMHLVIRFMIFKAPFRNISDTPSYSTKAELTETSVKAYKSRGIISFGNLNL